MTKKSIASRLHALPIAAAIFGLAISGANAQDGKGYWQKVQERGELHCGAADASPYVMRDPATGEYSGFFADLCREFAEVLKVKPVFIDTTWETIVAGQQAGKWDVSLALNRTPLRAMAIQFSTAAMHNEINFVYRKDNPKVPANLVALQDIDIEGVTIAVTSGANTDKVLTDTIKKATVMRLPSFNDGRLALTSGRADFFFDGSDTNQLFTIANPDWTATFSPTPPPAKQGVSFGLPPQLTGAEKAVADIFVEERVSTGHVDFLIRKAMEEAIKAGQ